MFALVISFSELKFDNRVNASVAALEKMGYRVSVLTLDSSNNSKRLSSFRQIRSLFFLLLGTLTSNFTRFYHSRDFVLEARRNLEELDSRGVVFQKIVVHDWEPLPLIPEKLASIIYLDCHEYSLDEPHPFFIKPFMDRYKSWLIAKHFKKEMKIAAVSKPIADAYENLLNKNVSVITNRHKLQNVDAQMVGDEIIRIAYSGKAGYRRGILRMFLLSLFLIGKAEIHLFLANESELLMRLYRALSFLNPGFVLHSPLERADLVRELAKFDMGIFISSSKTLNVQMSRPNKLYEYVAAALPSLSSAELELTSVMEEHSSGISLKKDFISQLMTIRSLNKKEIREMRKNVEDNRHELLKKLDNASESYQSWLGEA